MMEEEEETITVTFNQAEVLLIARLLFAHAMASYASPQLAQERETALRIDFKIMAALAPKVAREARLRRDKFS